MSLAKRERRSVLADCGVNGALFFLVKLDGLVCY